MISQEEFGFKSAGDLDSSPPKQRFHRQTSAYSVGPIYDPHLVSLRHSKPVVLTQGHHHHRKGEKHVNENVVKPIPPARRVTVAPAKDDDYLTSADGGNYEYQVSDDSHFSPRCVISNSCIGSSTSTNPAGSKAVSEMDDYSDVKQVISHNRSSSPSDADNDAFFGSLIPQKNHAASGFRSVDIPHAANLDNLLKPKNTKALQVLRSLRICGIVLVDTPLAPYFSECITTEDLDDMNIEIMRNTLYKAYLEDFYKFCKGLGGATAELMCDLLTLEADWRTVNITVNSMGTELMRDDRRKFYSNFGLLYPYAHEELAVCEDFDAVRGVVEKYPPYQTIFAKFSFGESQMLDKAFFEEKDD